MMSLTARGRFILNYSINFVSAILLIYVSKILFRYFPISGLTLTIINCLLSGVFASIALRCISKSPATTPSSTNRGQSLVRLFIVSASFSAFITFSNLSLQYNTIGTYQIIKLQVPPTLMLVEYIQLRLGLNSPLLTEEKFRRDYSSTVLLAFGIIVFGTLLNTYSDLRFHPLGVAFAFISVICNALYQALVQGDQASSDYQRMRFLQIQAFISAVILLPGWPFVDSTFEFNGFLFSRWDALTLLFMCGFLAYLVNSSVIWCIKDDTAIGFNMIGQLKTLFIVFLGSVLFREPLAIKQVISILFTTAGCLIYVYMTYKTKEHHQHQQEPGLNNI